jgi:hypothetical protein
MKIGAFVSLAALAIAYVPAHAQTKDFTITVPVSVSALPSNISEMGISCYVMPEDYGDASHQLAYGGQRFRVSGSYSGNVVISFNAAPGKDPSLARWYRCVGQFYGTERGVTATFFASGQNVAPNFPLAAGAPFDLGYSATRVWTRIPTH